MADGIIQLSPDSTGKKVDTEELVVGANTVHRERMQIAGDSPTDIAPVTAADGVTVNLGTNNDVTVASLPLPSGAATLAEQQTQSTALAAIETAVELLDDAIAGTELQVDVVAALPTGTNSIGQVTANAGTNLNTSALALEAGGNLAAAAASLSVLDDWDETNRAAVNLIAGQVGVQGGSGTINTLTQRVVLATDQPTVPVSMAAPPTGGATLAEQQTQTTHLAAIETAVEILDNAIAGSEMQVDVVASLPAGTNNIGDVDVLSSALPTGASTLAEQQTQTTHLATIAGDTTAIETAVQIMDDWDESDRAKVNPIAGQAGVQGASGAVTALTQRVVLATDVALPAGTNNIGDVDVLTLPALVAGTANIGDVDVLTMPVVEVVGDVAADAAVPANPLSIGGRASTAVPTAVSADGDSVYAWLNRLGMQVVSAIPGLGLNADPHTLLSETAQYTTTQTSTVLVAGGASERIVITSIQIQAGATTAATVQVYFGTGAYARGTDEAIFDGEFAPSATLKPGFYAAPPSGFRAGALGDDVLVTTSAGITLTVTIWYYILGV